MVKARQNALPGFGLTLSCTGAYVTLIVLLPIAALLLKSASMSPADFIAIVTSPRAIASYHVTLGAAAFATLINAFLGLLLAWILSRYDFPGRRILDAMIELPFALPTAVAGIALVTLFARNGWLGQYLDPLGLKVAYTQAGIVAAMTFTSLPFVVRTVQPVLADLDPELEEAGFLLGGNGAQVFSRIIFPAIFPAFLAGCSLSFARSLGEFGAVIFIAGNLPMKTEITALLVFIRLEEFDYPAAAAYATVLLVISFVLLLVTNAIQSWHLRYMKAD